MPAAGRGDLRGANRGTRRPPDAYHEALDALRCDEAPPLRSAPIGISSWRTLARYPPEFTVVDNGTANEAPAHTVAKQGKAPAMTNTP